MEDALRVISGVSPADKANLVALLKSRNYREVGILEMPGESEYMARPHIKNFSGSNCDMEWTITYAVHCNVT